MIFAYLSTFKNPQTTCFYLFIRGIITKSLFYLLCLRIVYAMFTHCLRKIRE